MGSFPQSIVHYLPVTDHDERWGIVCTTAGYQNVPPGSPYPLTQHPDSYSFTRSPGARARRIPTALHRLGTG